MDFNPPKEHTKGLKKPPLALAYRYRMTSFIVPLWLSSKEYVVTYSDGNYASLGQSVKQDIQEAFNIKRSKPRVPWGFDKFLVYIFAHLIYFILLFYGIKHREEIIDFVDSYR